MINIRRWFVDLLTRADEEIIQTERRIELEQYESLYNKTMNERKKQTTLPTEKKKIIPNKSKKKASHKRRTSREIPIIIGDDSKVDGVIKDYGYKESRYRYYFNNSDCKTPCQKYFSDKQEAIDFYHLINEERVTPERFNKLALIPKRDSSMIYISKVFNQKGEIRYNLRKKRWFGSCKTLDYAMSIRDYLVYKNWDLDLKARNLGITISQGDEYYFTMKPIIEGDTEYQEYLKTMEE